MREISKDELQEILARHSEWLRNEPTGKRATLTDANLSYATLSRANLSYATLSRANLTGANLSGATLTGVNLSYATLTGADLWGVNLTGAVGSNSRIQSLQIEPYKIIILDKETVWGGCTKNSAQWWLEYTGEGLSASNKKYLETVTKPFIRMVLEQAK